MTTHETFTLTNSDVPYEVLPAREGNGRDVTIQNNNGSAAIYIGGSGVTTTDFGFKLLPGAAIAFELDGRDSIWAVTDTNAATVNIMSVNLEGSHHV